MAKEVIMRGLDKIITGSGTELNLDNISSALNGATGTTKVVAADGYTWSYLQAGALLD